MIGNEQMNSLQNKITINESVKRSGKFALLATVALLVISFFYVGSSVDPVGGTVVLVVLPLWATLLFIPFWLFVWSVTEFWRINRYRSMMLHWRIRLFLAIVFCFGFLLLTSWLSLSFIDG